MKKKKKAFTLVELLAVIVIIAIILVIAVPRILDAIKASRLSSIESSAKLIAKNAENYYLAEKAKDSNYNEQTIECNLVAEVSDDYGVCTVTFDENGSASVKVKGAANSKYNGLKCTGTKDNITCTERSGPTPEWVYAYGPLEDSDDGEADYRNLKDGDDNQALVFIKYKSDLSERKLCTMYKSTENGGPTCFTLDWDTIQGEVKTLFGEKECTEEIVSRRKYITCTGTEDSIGYECEISSGGWRRCKYNSNTCYLDLGNNPRCS